MIAQQSANKVYMFFYIYILIGQQSQRRNTPSSVGPKA